MKLNFLSNLLGKKKEVGYDANFLKFMYNQNLTYVGQDITDCGTIRIDSNTMYRIHKLNKMAFAYKNKIAQMVGRYGLECYNDRNEIIENRYAKDNIQQFYNHIGGRNKLNMLIADFFDELFCNGQVFAVPTIIN